MGSTVISLFLFLEDVSKSSTLLSILTDCFNDVKEILNFKIFNYVGDDFVEKLQLQDKILSVNPNIPNNVKQYLNWYFQKNLDKVLLIAYLYENENFSFVSNKEFLGEMTVSKFNEKMKTFVKPTIDILLEKKIF